MDKKNYFYYAKMYGIPCYYQAETYEVIGRNRFYDWILEKILIPYETRNKRTD